MAEKKSSSKKSGGSRSHTTAAREAAAPYQKTIRTLEYLGGRSSVLSGMKITEEKDFISLIKKGIPRKSLDQLIISTGLTSAEIAAMMHTSDRTLRRYKPSTLLNPEQSERVIEIARLYSRGEEVLGNQENFKEWMNATLPSLGGSSPKDFLDTSMGIEILIDTLGRLDPGVFS